MSRLAKKPVILPENVKASIENGLVKITGSKGEKIVPILSEINVRPEGNFVFIEMNNGNISSRTNAGTMWSLIRNAASGVSAGFSKTLEIQGVGFRAALEGANLVLSLGFANPIKYSAPSGVKMEIEKNLIKISGIDKELVGLAAAQIRALKKPEPYKGKGIRYQGEVIRMKAGKKAATAG